MGKNFKKIISLLLVTTMITCGNISSLRAEEIQMPGDQQAETITNETNLSDLDLLGLRSGNVVSDLNSPEENQDKAFKVTLSGESNISMSCNTYKEACEYITDKKDQVTFSDVLIEVLSDKISSLEEDDAYGCYQDNVLSIKQVPQMAVKYTFSSGVKLCFAGIEDASTQNDCRIEVINECTDSTEFVIQNCSGTDFILNGGNTQITETDNKKTCGNLTLLNGAAVVIRDETINIGDLILGEEGDTNSDSGEPKLKLYGENSLLSLWEIISNESDENANDAKLCIEDKVQRTNNQEIIHSKNPFQKELLSYSNATSANAIITSRLVQGQGDESELKIVVSNVSEIRTSEDIESMIDEYMIVGSNKSVTAKDMFSFYDTDENYVCDAGIESVKSSDSDVLAVEFVTSDLGDEYLLIPKKFGTATITITSNCIGEIQKIEKYNIKVESENTKYHLDKKEITINLEQNDSAEIAAFDVNGRKAVVSNWSSDNEAVATVFAGKVTGWTEGSANITATFKDGSECVCRITVVDPIRITMSQGRKELVDEAGRDTDVFFVNFAPANKFQNEAGVDYAFKIYLDNHECDLNIYRGFIVEYNSECIVTISSLSSSKRNVRKDGYRIKLLDAIDSVIEEPAELKIECEISINGNSDETIKKEIKYTLIPKDTSQIPDDFKAYALTNTMKTLADVQPQLDKIETRSGNKWTFVDKPTTKLIAKSGQKFVSYKAKYEKTTGDVRYTDVPVYLTSITGVSFSSLPAAITSEDKPETNVALKTTGCSISEIESIAGSTMAISPDAEIASNSTGIIKVEKGSDNNLSVTPLNIGKASVLPKVKFSFTDSKFDFSVKGKLAYLKVVDQLASISYSMSEKDGASINEGDTLIVGKEYIFKDTTEGYYSSDKVSSTNSKVLKVSKTKTDKNSKVCEYKITPVGYGAASILIQSNDAAKTKQEVGFKVADYTQASLSLAETIYTFDTGLSIGAAEEREVSGQILLGANEYETPQIEFYTDKACKKTMEAVSASKCIRSSTDSTVCDFKMSLGDYGGKSKTIRGYAKLTVKYNSAADSISKIVPVTVIVKETKPKITVKELTKANSITGKGGSISVKTSAGTCIKNISLAGLEDGTIGNVVVKKVSYDNFIVEYDLLKSESKYTAKVIIETRSVGSSDDYNPSEYVINLNSIVHKYELKYSYGGIKNAEYLVLSDKTEKRDLISADICGMKLSSISIDGERKSDEESSKMFSDIYEFNSLSLKFGYLCLSPKKNEEPKNGEKLHISFNSENLLKPITVDYTVMIKDINLEKLSLSNPTVIVYKYSDQNMNNEDNCYDSDLYFGKMKMSGNVNTIISEDERNTGYPNLGKSLDVFYDGYIKKVRISLKESRDIKPGKTYKFTVTVPAQEFTGYKLEKPISTSLSVKVVEVKNMSECVSVKTKGSVDLFARAQSGITVTPKLAKLPLDSEIKSVSLAGEDAELFEISDMDNFKETGTFRICARENAKLMINRTYKVYPRFVIGNLTGRPVEVTLSKPINIKPKQGKPTT